MTTAVLETRLKFSNHRAGKVCDRYDVTLDDGTEALLIVATDRCCAFDVLLGNGLPGKGIVLTQLSKFWFDHFGAEYDHHLLSTDVKDVPRLTKTERKQLDGRIMLCRKSEVIPIECSARGYLTANSAHNYQPSDSVRGIRLPTRFKIGDRLAQPLFTLSTKAANGREEKLSLAQGVGLVGAETMGWLEQATLALYERAHDYALARGIILADSKFEFGQLAGRDEPLLIASIFTPDRSSYWPAALWQPGREQVSFDQQFVREYLADLVQHDGWDRSAPGPELPCEVVAETMARYLEVYQRITESRLRL